MSTGRFPSTTSIGGRCLGATPAVVAGVVAAAACVALAVRLAVGGPRGGAVARGGAADDDDDIDFVPADVAKIALIRETVRAQLRRIQADAAALAGAKLRPAEATLRQRALSEEITRVLLLLDGVVVRDAAAKAERKALVAEVMALAQEVAPDTSSDRPE